MLTEPTESCSPHVLFFSRGKGRGHAIPDIAIADELLRRRQDIGVTFVSYSQGYSTLKAHNKDVIDLGLAEDAPLWDATVAIIRLLQSRRDRLIVSHEEFAVPPIAAAFGLRSVFITDWFSPADSLQMRSLKYASKIIFLDDAGYYEEPAHLSGRVYYVGTVLRPLVVTRQARELTRQRLGIPSAATVILVVPGGSGFHKEDRAPVFDLVAGAYDLLDVPEKRLLWVVGSPDYETLVSKRGDRRDIMILKPHFDFTPTLNASDVLVTKGNRLPLLEAEMFGMPSLSISYGHNPIDDYRAGLIKTNTALRARCLNPASLKLHLERAIQSATQRRHDWVNDTLEARAAAAHHLQEALEGDLPMRVSP